MEGYKGQRNGKEKMAWTKGEKRKGGWIDGEGKKGK